MTINLLSPTIFSANTANANKSSKPKKKQKEIKGGVDEKVLSVPRINPVLLSVSEAAKIGGVTDKTIRRAIQAKKLNYKIVNNRYQIDLTSLIKYLYTTTKLKNKLNINGIGQYIEKWRK
ncbi:hypothetical protein DRH27_04525 [Candidatus Falkowbacteria bacterium]|nr:MAG: hypothetical protein DRH27_04525 [Candidatus Falkowbacteria bacterium]